MWFQGFGPHYSNQAFNTLVPVAIWWPEDSTDWHKTYKDRKTIHSH